VKHHVAALAAAAGIDLASQSLTPIAGPFFGWQEGHSTAAGNIEQGWTARFGLLNLAMVKAFGLEGKVYAGIFAILPERLATVATRRRYADFSLFPAALRDLALVVDAGMPAAEVQRTLATVARAAAGNALTVESVSVFDVYKGAGLPDGKKSLAFSLVFRSAERTLTDDEVNTALAKIQKDIAADGKISVRT
jgi:phenylalanyl-tRNA synthetase beta chain